MLSILHIMIINSTNKMYKINAFTMYLQDSLKSHIGTCVYSQLYYRYLGMLNKTFKNLC